MSRLKIANWNIGSLYADLERNLPYFTEVISGSGADVFCMQEFPIREEIANTVMRLGKFPYLKLDETSESHVCKENRMGIAIFSKFPLTQVDKIELPKPQIRAMREGAEEIWHSKFFTITRCEQGDDTPVIITGHGFPFHRYGLEKTEYRDVISRSFSVLDEWITNYLKENENGRVYLPADFNITSPLDFMPKLRNVYYDSFDGCATRPSGRKTDTMLLPRGVDFIDRENLSIYSPDGAVIFDHNYISVTINNNL